MTSKTILMLAITAAFVIGTLTSGTDAFAKDKPNGQPFNAIWMAIGNLQDQIDSIGDGEQGPVGEQGPSGT